MGEKDRISKILILGLFTILITSGTFTFSGSNNKAEAAFNGSQPECPEFIDELLRILPIGFPDPVWILVDPDEPFKEVSGVVTSARVSHTDFPTVHDSHDTIVDIIADPGYEDLISDVNRKSSDDLQNPIK